MTGLWKINDIDLFSVFGAYIFKGNYNELLAPPMPRKRLEHEYTDQDGVSVDTTSPLTYEAKRFNIKVGMKGNSAADFWTKYEAFFGVLSQPGSFELYIADLDKTFTMLYEGVAKTEKLTPIEMTSGQVYATFEIKLLEPLTTTNETLTVVVTTPGGDVSLTGNPFELINGDLFLNL